MWNNLRTYLRKLVSEGFKFKTGDTLIGKSLKVFGIIGDVYLAVSLFDDIKDYIFGDSKTVATKQEILIRTILDPTIVFALATEDRRDIISNMLCARAFSYVNEGSDILHLYGMSLLACSQYVSNVQGLHNLYFSKEDAQAIIKDAKNTEFSDLTKLDEFDEFLSQDRVEDLDVFKFIDYFAFFIDANYQDFPPLLNSPSNLQKV